MKIQPKHSTSIPPLPFALCFLLFAASCNTKSGNEQTVRPGGGSMCGTEPVDTAWYSSGKKAPLLSGLDGINFPITTKNAEAQKYFNQGLMLSFGFNHAEAARSFYEAARLDSSCAMCWWGFAYVLGPNYNAGMEPDNFQRAYAASQKAMMYANAATPLERELIMALNARYSNDVNKPRAEMDSAFSAEMRRVYNNHKNDATITALFAESLMDLHPWNLWLKDGKPQPWTNEILSVLESGLKLDAKHAGLNHFYIHATEASRQPEKAMASADLLMNLVPGSGHLVHMASHTYIRTGRYHDGSLSNLKSVEVDSTYVEACHAQGAYPLVYYPHNYHFLAATGTLEGNRANAMNGAQHVQNLVNKKLMKDPAWSTLQHYYTVPWNVEVKFAEWDKILKHEMPDSNLVYPTTVLYYARGMAYLGKNNLKSAKEELQRVKFLADDTSVQNLTIWGINKMSDLLQIAQLVLKGEYKAKQEKYDDAIEALLQAVALEDALNYDEPPDWFFSVRHHLGAVQIEAGLYKDAIKTYEEDLKVFPENVWALAGLHNALSKLGKTAEADAVKKRLDVASQYADVKIESSRIW